MDSVLNTALLDGARVIIIMYDLVVTPSCAVATVVIVFWPIAKEMPAEAAPEIMGAPFTVIVAVGSCATAVMLTDVTVFATVAV
jgi:hypothetical protein